MNCTALPRFCCLVLARFRFRWQLARISRNVSSACSQPTVWRCGTTLVMPPGRPPRPATIDIVNLGDELQRIYDSEINIRISWVWDGGIDVWIGDDLNGYVAQGTLASVNDIVPWLQEAVAHFNPDSEYAASLSADVRERAANRLFQPPRIGAQVRCPHCRSPHASPIAFDQLLAYTCEHCGKFVEVLQPKTQ
jgi:DNA-directed RNA polymerase subunit RPC12/RpoP